MEEMKIKLKTLTPIWTGGVDQKLDCLHETGFIGSLRWWYEALVRGMGGYACDPTEDVCIYDPNEPNGGLCDACRLFGTTGWGRKFRLAVSENTGSLIDFNVKIPSGRRGGWYLFGASQMGKIQLNLQALRGIEKKEEVGLQVVLLLICRHAAFLAKTSNGYGVITQDGMNIPNDWMKVILTRQNPRNSQLPDLRDFFFSKFTFDEPQNDPEWWKQIRGIEEAINQRNDTKQMLDQSYQKNVLPLAPAVRNWLRYQWRNGLDPCEDHYVFGKARAVCPNCCVYVNFREDRRDPRKFWCPKCKRSFRKGDEMPSMASKINVSYAYRRSDGKWEFRIWGWLPCMGGLRDRDEFLNALKKKLEAHEIWNYVFGARSNEPNINSNITPKMLEWYALDSQQEDLALYLQELLSSNNGGAR